jgi:hypothetical protein
MGMYHEKKHAKKKFMGCFENSNPFLEMPPTPYTTTEEQKYNYVRVLSDYTRKINIDRLFTWCTNLNAISQTTWCPTESSLMFASLILVGL